MSSPEPDATSAPVTLSDLLGALACDVTAARARADAEAIRIARIYRADPLLRTLPAPLFRLADLTISLPIAIVAVPTAGQPQQVPLGLAAATVLALVLDALGESAGESGGGGASGGESRGGGPGGGGPRGGAGGGRAGGGGAGGADSGGGFGELRGRPGDAAVEVARAIERERARLEHEAQAPREPTEVADALLDAALGALTAVQRTLAEAGSHGGGSGFEPELRVAVRARLLALTPPPGVQIAATTAAIESVSARDSLAQLRVNLAERGVEWAIGEHSERLVPE